jgi:hypothetical protein
MSDERVWLRHTEHGGYFHCPAAAVKDWTTPVMGWAIADVPPEEYNPVLAEALAARKALAEERAQAEQAEKATAKTGRKSGTEPQES